MMKLAINGKQKVGCAVAKINFKALKKIKCMATDVDGVLTDGSLFMQSPHEWRRLFFIRDGIGILNVQRHGYKTAFLTSSKSEDIHQRALNLKIDYFYDDAADKGTAFDKFLQESQLEAKDVLYIGDDVIDLPILRRCGFACAPKDAHPEVLKSAHYIAKLSGGRGAVREVCDLLIKWGQLSLK